MRGRPLKYPWDELKKQGDWVLIPDIVGQEIATAVKLFVARKFGNRAIVVTRTIPTGAIVFLAYVPFEATTTPEYVKDMASDEDGYEDVADLLDDSTGAEDE